MSVREKHLAAEHAVFEKDRSFTTSDGTHIAYSVVNADDVGIPVVFMNGWTCPDAYWKVIGPGIVDAGHPAVFFDARGHAQSGLPRAPGLFGQKLKKEDLTVERLARDVIELLEAAGIEKAVLMGHSMGVQGLFEAYRVAPERVAGLIPVAGTYENPVPTFANQAFLDRLFPIADVLFRRVPFVLLRPVLAQGSRFPSLGVRAVRFLHVANHNVTAEDIAPHAAQFSELNMSVLWRIMSEMRAHSAAEVLPTVQVPVLILAGRKDLFTPQTVQERMHSLLPDSELVWFEEGGHLLPVEEASGIVSTVNDFLARRIDVTATA